MLTNYLKTAVRQLIKYKTNTLVNVIGLSLALASLMLISLWVHDEVTFDYHHTQADRIFKINSNVYTADNSWHLPVTPTAWGPTLVEEHAEIESAARVSNPRDITLGVNGRYEIESKFVWADHTIFDMFSLPLIAGDANHVLATPFTVVITKEVAARYWNHPEDAVGEMVSIDGDDSEYQIVGVVADQPRNSLLSVRGFISMATLYSDRYSRPRLFDFRSHYDNTFVLATPGTGTSDIEALFPAFLARHIDADVLQRTRYEPEVIALKDVHLRSEVEELAPVGSVTRVQMFVAVGLIILLLAVANFINLSMAHLARRLSDFGLRKILGASRGQLVTQMVIQAFFIATGALFIASIIVESSVDVINDMTGKQLHLVASDYAIFVVFNLVMVIIVALSAAVPVLRVSWRTPIKYVMSRAATSRRSTGVRSVLVTIQFGISLALLLATITVFRQTEYMKDADIGYEPEYLVTFDTTEATRTALLALTNALRNQPNVTDVAACYVLPSVTTVGRSYSIEGESPDDRMLLSTYYVDAHFIPTLGLDLVEGRNFSERIPSDSTDAFVVNEAFLRYMGWETASGKRLVYHRGDYDKSGPIIGVVRDFAQTSLHNVIKPCVLQIEPDRRNYKIVARLGGNDRASVVGHLESVWREFEKDSPFQYRFYNDIIVDLYESEQQLGSMVLAFAVLAITIACLGLFGLVAYRTEQARKEIGLRKALGATALHISTLMSKDFLRILVIAMAIALPVAHYAMVQWLNKFAYHVEVNPLSYIMTIGAVLTAVLLTVNVRAYSASRSNPVELLRHE